MGLEEIAARLKIITSEQFDMCKRTGCEDLPEMHAWRSGLEVQTRFYPAPGVLRAKKP